MPSTTVNPPRKESEDIPAIPIAKLSRGELTLSRLGLDPRLAEFEPTDSGRKAPGRLLHALIKKGLTNIQISWVVEDLYGETYTRAAVSYFRKVNGYPMKHPTEAALNLIPWTVAEVHNEEFWYKVLVYEARERSGTELNYRSRATRDRGQRELLAATRAAGHVMVINYDRDSGFSLVRARDGIDTDLIRDPRLSDDGSPDESFRPRWGAEQPRHE